MSDELPRFDYYDDPVGDGTFIASPQRCGACGRSRGWIAPKAILYSATVPDSSLFCPWCIADGTAVGRYPGTFNELDGRTEAVVRAAVEERTPNFETWQDWDWPVHCEDAMVYAGQPKAGMLRQFADAYQTLVSEIARDMRMSAVEAADLVNEMGPDRSVVAYLFRCRGCGSHLVRWDQD